MSARAGDHPPFAPRRRVSWLVYGLCALLVVDVLAWATWRVLALERAERAASAEADTAQRERLALWQMDSAVSALLARESARPYFEFRSSYAADLPYGRAWETESASSVRTSALAGGTGDPVVRLHYQIEPDGSIGSPQAGSGSAAVGPAERADEMRFDRLVLELDRALAEGGEPGFLRANAGRAALSALGDASDFPDPMSARSESMVSADRAGDGEPRDSDGRSAGQTLRSKQEGESAERDGAGGGLADPGAAEPEETEAGEAEPVDIGLRQQLFEIARSGNSAFNMRQRQVDAREPIVTVGLLQPRWLPGEGEDPELVFERPVRVGDARYRQGVWVDWPALRAQLLSIAVRQMPGATLEPVLGAGSGGTDTLATIPVRLVTPEPGAGAGGVGASVWTPARVTLAVSWVAALVALVAVGVVLRTAIRLADRRGRFVAAVSHELRSPITSLRLHTDLLARAPDGEKRGAHIAVLRDEAARLGGVIDSVLVYAGMRSAGAGAGETRLDAALAPLFEQYRPRVEAAGARFEVAIPERAGAAAVRLRPGSLERIVGNLLENACRYGVAVGEGREAVVRVEASVAGGRVRVRVRDNGPGIPPGERRAIFADFSRGASSRRVHRGMGLGLALARALARAEGGRLTLVDADGPGACFELTLPAAQAG